MSVKKLFAVIFVYLLTAASSAAGEEPLTVAVKVFKGPDHAVPLRQF
jgi:hypothetical protein